MSLSTFIIENLEQILAEWESFAATIIPDQKFDKHVLRDHAEAILKAIALDMRIEQTEDERDQKSLGLGQRIDDKETGDLTVVSALRSASTKPRWCRNTEPFVPPSSESG